MRALSARESRLVAIGLLVAVLLGILGLVVQPLAEGFLSRAEERADLEAEYQRNARLLDGAAGWRAAAARQAETAPSFTLAAEDMPAATENLRGLLGEVFTEAGSQVRTVSEQAAPRPGWAGAGLEAEMALPQLHDALSRLAREHPPVIVDGISVTTLRNDDIGAAPRISVRIEVSAPTALRPAEGAPAADGN
ncbi:type II secretion system protein GspM [Zavarzinia sp.]|uniref:type II secretion system protein GspM n=1 Tax=Zavarzinia sp. TaxID=2027920 RepID=UPI003BB7651E|nr:type II secretion system protein GspM [Zavarzinia sp.]